MDRKTLLAGTLAMLFLAECRCKVPPPEDGKKDSPPSVHEPGVPISSKEFEFQRLKVLVKNRISLKDGGVLEPNDGHEFLLIQLQVKCLKLTKMFARGAVREANVLNLAVVGVGDDIGKVHKCSGYGSEPEDIKMKICSLLFTPEEMQRTLYLLFEVKAPANGLKLLLPDVPPMDLPL